MSTHVAAASSLVLQPSTLEVEGAVLHDAELPDIIPSEAARSAPQGGSTPPRRGKKIAAPMRKSTRIAALSWALGPRGMRRVRPGRFS